MAYTTRIDRANPTCFLFLLDQSTSMKGPIRGVQGNPSKADFVADALNRVIDNLVILATKDEGIRRYYQVGVVGYSGHAEIHPAFGGKLEGRDLVWVDELGDNPLRIEDRIKSESDGVGGFIQVNVKFRVWFDPYANGNTPMCKAMEHARDILAGWMLEHPNSYPPTVINLTDGEATDGDPQPFAEEIKALSNTNGNAILMTLHVSSNPDFESVVFPSHEELIPPGAAHTMFRMSSVLPQNMLQYATQVAGYDFPPDSKAFVYNAGIEEVIRALDIGTSTVYGNLIEDK